MSDHESDDEVEEIKISDVKDQIIKQQQEEDFINKKRQRKLNKKKKNKKIDLSQYKKDVQATLGEDLTNNTNLLINTKKVINIDENEDDTKPKKKKVYKKNDIIIRIEEKNAKEEYTPIPDDVLQFKRNHFFGERLNRTKNFLNKI